MVGKEKRLIADAERIFDELRGEDNVVSGSAVRGWIKEYEDISKEELITAWDVADVFKRGCLSLGQWQSFLNELDFESNSAASSTSKENQVALSDSTVAMCLLASALTSDVDQFNPAFLERCRCMLRDSAHVDYSRLVGIGKDRARERLASSLIGGDTKKRQELLALLLWREACCRGVAYDSRARRAFREVAEAWKIHDFAAFEARVLRAALKRAAAEKEAKKLSGSKEKSSAWSWTQYAKVGGASLAAGLMVAATAGVAAPIVAAAFAGSTFWGAGMATAIASSTGVFALGFGAAGGGLAGYRMKRRVAGLTDFEFVADTDPRPRGGTAVLIPGSLRDVYDYASICGLPLPKEAPLRRRLSRALASRKHDSEDKDEYQQLVSESEVNAFWLLAGCQDDLPDTENEAKLANILYNGDTTKTVDAKAPDSDSLDDDETNDDQIVTAIFETLGSTSSKNETTDDAAFSAEAAAVDHLFFASNSTNPKHTQHTARRIEFLSPPPPLEVSKASQLFDSALKDAEEAKEDTKTLNKTPASKQIKKKRKKNTDPPLWWWRQRLGPALGLEAVGLIWERELLVEVSTSMEAMATSLATSGAQEAIIYGAAASTAAVVLSSLVLPIALVRATKYIDGTWTVGIERADAAGIALADALYETRSRPVTLIGYSLGARVIFSCLTELARRNKEARLSADSSSDAQLKDSFCGLVEDAILLGAPIPASFAVSGNESDPWHDAASVVAGRLVNAYSNNDLVLALLYRSQSWATRIAGLHPLRHESVLDFNITDFVQDHNDYPRLLPILLTHIYAGIDPLDLNDCAPPPKLPPDDDDTSTKDISADFKP